jgi:hypothetical protein
MAAQLRQDPVPPYVAGELERGDRATATLEATAAETAQGSVRLQIELERQGGDWPITGLGAGDNGAPICD